MTAYALSQTDSIGIYSGVGIPVITPRMRSLLEYKSDDRALFDHLAAQWKQDTLFSSSVDDIIRHPAYLQIIGLGQMAVTFILEDLQRDPHHWFIALNAITRTNPALPRDQGNVAALASAWLDWGRQNGLL